jgi:beta-galactosidase
MPVLLVLMMLVPLVVTQAQEVKPGDELAVNGNFETADASGKRPAGWGWDGGSRWETDGVNHWIVQEATAPKSISVSQTIPMQERYWKIRVTCRVRTENVVMGAEGWHDARIAMQFQDADGKMVGSWPNVLHFTGTTKGWENQERDYLVPPGARKLAISCSLFSTTGKVEWDDVSFKLLKFDPVPEDATLPPGVTARWDYENAEKSETATRGKVCINGLWRFHPVDLKQTDLPGVGTGWGYHKVPGSWAPGTSRMTPLGPDIWEESLDLSKTDAAWYERQITIPGSWAGRRVLVNLDNPKNIARVFVDGKEAGRVQWPGGKVDITSLVSPITGTAQHRLSIHVIALPLEAEQIMIAREDLIQTMRAEVKFKGLCGDCYLESEPVGARVEDVFVKPSVRKGGLGLQCEAAGLTEGARYQLRASVYEVTGSGSQQKIADTPAMQISSAAFVGPDCPEFFGAWTDAKLWDIDQPNMYAVKVELLDGAGKVLDVTTPETFGFREFWIDGRSFVLNGKPIHLRCLDLSNHLGNFGQAAYAQVRHTFEQARALGFNYVIHGNYDYEPQSFTYIADLLRAGDDAGFPMSYSVRHIKRDVRNMDDPVKRAEWERIVKYEVRQVRNHPSVFMWAMNHNMLGWADDQNPARMTGLYEPRPEDNPGMATNRHAATVAENLVMSWDGTRPAYHHQSGPFNQMITLNCYLCFTPLQERIEWLSRWAQEGIKPLFFVEFGLPHQASWGGHRTGPFVWTNPTSSEPLVQEFGAMFYGDAAYDLPQYAIDHYDTIARVYATHQPFHISSVLGAYWDRRWEKNFLEIKTLHTLQTWPAFRTWGISAILPWDQADLFKQKEGVSGKEVSLPTDWDALQRPGLAPESVAWTSDWLQTPDPSAIEMTSLGRAFAKVNRETLAYLAGPERRFTAKDHIFRPGETVEKQVAMINDLRHDAEFAYTWTVSLGGRQLATKSGQARVAAGDRALVPFQFQTPAGIGRATGRIDLVATVEGKGDESLRDSFSFTVLEATTPVKQTTQVALYDPKGLTAPVLRAAGLEFATVQTPQAAPGVGLLIIGREAVSADSPGIDLVALTRRGVNVLFFEQTEEVLQRRWGFRTASPGVRRVFVRQPGSPVCQGLEDELLRDWRGSSSLLEAYPEPVGYRGSYPQEVWCGFPNSRTWQWGNYGCVASVVIEKPAVGNYSSLLDCEFDCQYTPLLEWRTGAGRVLLCQLDLTGRDMPEPAAERLLANLLNYAQSAPAAEERKLSACKVVGSQAYVDLMKSLGADTTGRDPVVITPGADPVEARAAIAGANTVLCLAMDAEALNAVLPFAVETEERKLVNTLIGRPQTGALVGLGNADLHWRAKTAVPCLTQVPEGLRMAPNGVLAEGTVGGKHYVLMQWSPGSFDWNSMGQLRRTWRNSLRALGTVLTNCGVNLQSPLPERVAASGVTSIDLSGEWRLQVDRESRLQGEQVASGDFDASSWRPLRMPGTFEAQLTDLANYDGVVWLRKEFNLTQVPTNEPLTLTIGGVDDEDWTYLNGRFVGHIGQNTHPTNYWEAMRRYPLTRDVLKAGRNVIAVKVKDLRQSGGITKGPISIVERERWLEAHYLDAPEALDDPYRYNRW